MISRLDQSCDPAVAIAAANTTRVDPEPKIALCLSGGLRATFFHFGVIKLLRRAKFFCRRLLVISGLQETRPVSRS